MVWHQRRIFQAPACMIPDVLLHENTGMLCLYISLHLFIHKYKFLSHPENQKRGEKVSNSVVIIPISYTAKKLIS